MTSWLDDHLMLGITGIGVIGFKQALGILKKPPDRPLTFARVTEKWSVHNCKKKVLMIHAYVQVALQSSKHGQSPADRLLYYGCSQPSSFVRWRFLQDISRSFESIDQEEPLQTCHGYP